MAAGLVSHNITTASGVTFAVVSWVPDTSSPDVGAIPIHMVVNSSGTAITPALEAGGNLAAILAKITNDPATATLQTSIGTKLDTLHTDLATTLAAYVDGLETLDTAISSALGTTAGAKVITDANGTIQQYLRGLVTQWVSSTLTLASRATTASASVTRPANTTAYTANDVVGPTGGGTSALQFSSMGPSGATATIVGAKFEIDDSAVISGETTYRLHLYNVTPPSALADNAAWDLPSGDRASYLGYVELNAYGALLDLGSTVYVQTDALSIPVKLSGTDIFGYLVTIGNYTPTSGRGPYKVTLHTVY